MPAILCFQEDILLPDYVDALSTTVFHGCRCLLKHALKRLSPHEQLNRQLHRDEPKRMLEGTIRVVQMCYAYAARDGCAEEFGRLLDMQKYNIADATDARYVFTFDLCGKAFARVLVDSEAQTLDLADLYGSVWFDYQVAGFHYLWITHPDWSKLTNEEMRHLEDVITNDLLFDYEEDELDIWIDESPEGTYLVVMVQDMEPFTG